MMLRLSILWLFCIALAPLLILQGMMVRRRALRLDEAAGVREVKAEAGQKSILVLGDSIVVGVGVDDSMAALPARLAHHLSEVVGGELGWRAVGKNGAKLEELLASLAVSVNPGEQPALIVVNIGVNDVTSLTSMMRWQLQLTTLVSEVKQRFDVPLVLVGLPPMHAFPLLPQPLRFALGVRAKLLDHSLQRIAAVMPWIYHAKPTLPLDTEYMAIDGYHPGPVAVDMWSEAITHELNHEGALKHF